MDIVSHSERKLALEMQTPCRGVPLPDVSPLRISESNGGVGTVGEFARNDVSSEN